MPSSSSCSSIRKRDLRSRQVVVKKQKKAKKCRRIGENAVKDIGFHTEKISNDFNINGNGGVAHGRSVAAQKLDMLYRYEQLDNEQSNDESFDNEPLDNEPVDNEPVDNEPNEHTDNEQFDNQSFNNQPFDNEPADYEQFDNGPLNNQSDDENNDQDCEDAPVSNQNVAVDQNAKKRERKENKRYNNLKKDLTETNQRMDMMMKEWRAVKKIIQRWGPHPDSDDEMDDEENYDELPRLPLKKYKHIILMCENLENRSYKKQLVSLISPL